MRRLLVHGLIYIPLCLALAPAPSLPEQGDATKRTPRPASKPTARSSVPTLDEMDRLARTDPITFLDNCLLRHDREVTGYKLTFIRKERLRNQERKEEVINAFFRVSPYSVRMDWLKNPSGATRLLYVEGQNKNSVIILPQLVGFLGPRELALSDSRIKNASRFPLTDFGLRAGMARARRTWGDAKDKGELHVTASREVCKETGRECWKLHRKRFSQAEHDGVTEATLWIDRETWLLAGSLETGKTERSDKTLLGYYYFRDVQLNPTFDSDTFTRQGIAKKAARKTAQR